MTSIYDYPKYYDLVYGSDWKAEFDFLRECYAKHAFREVRRVFEPACGTGRLLYPLARAGYEVAGNDLNPRAVEYCNARLERHGFKPTAVVGDMADFTLTPPADAAHNMINSFRHLATEDEARAHFRAMAGAVAEGGIYVLGLHLTQTEGQPVGEENWSARRGHLAVITRLKTVERDFAARQETALMTLDVYTPTRRLQIEDRLTFRTYTARQMDRLVRQAAGWEIAGNYDFTYCIDRPIAIGPATEDVVYVLRRT